MRNRRNRRPSSEFAINGAPARASSAEPEEKEEGLSSMAETDDHDDAPSHAEASQDWVPTFDNTTQPPTSANGFGDLRQQLADQRQALLQLREQVAALRAEYARIGEDLNAARGQTDAPGTHTDVANAMPTQPTEDASTSAVGHASDEPAQPASLQLDEEPAQSAEPAPPEPPAPAPEPPRQERKRGLLSWGRR